MQTFSIKLNKGEITETQSVTSNGIKNALKSMKSGKLMGTTGFVVLVLFEIV